MDSQIEKANGNGKIGKVDRVPSGLKERIKGILIGITLERAGEINNGTLVDNLDKVISVGIDDSLLLEYKEEMESLEKDLEWDDEENRPISELVLRKLNGNANEKKKKSG